MSRKYYDEHGIPIPPKKGTKGSKYEKGFVPKDWNKDYGFSGYKGTRQMFWDMMGKDKAEKYLGAKQDEITEGMRIGKKTVLVILAAALLL